MSYVKTKKEVLDFLRKYKKLIEEGKDIKDALISTLEEYPLEYDKFYTLLSVSTDIDTIFEELDKISKSKYSDFCYKQIAFMFRIKEEPISLIEDTIMAIENEFYI